MFNLQFEWAWQHPTESLAVRKAASSFKSLSGFANKIKLCYTMLTLPSWENLNLTVNFFSTKYTKHIAGCPRLPNQMRFDVCAMDDLAINLSASAGVTVQEMNRNFNQMGNSASCNWELPELSNSTEEEGINDLSNASKRVIECRRRDSITSLSPSSCTDGLLLSPEVTVINLCTPSSGIIRSKTKRALFDAAIIDLTDSPMVIQV